MGLNRESEEEKRHVPLVIGLLSPLVMCWSDLALFWDLGFRIKSFLGMQTIWGMRIKHSMDLVKEPA